MDELISNLPYGAHNMYIYNNTEFNEGNVCTEAQVAAAKDKSWTLWYADSYYVNAWGEKEYDWKEYGGSNEATNIALPKAETMNGIVSIYNLAGQKVTILQKGGIYVVGGKKVVVK